MKRLLKDKRGEGFVDVCVLVLAIAMVLALVVRIAPVFVAKQNLDVFADVQPREHQRHHNDGQEAEEEACPELGVAHVTPCSGSLRRAQFR